MIQSYDHRQDGYVQKFAIFIEIEFYELRAYLLVIRAPLVDILLWIASIRPFIICISPE